MSDLLDTLCEIEALCASCASQRMSSIEKRHLAECHQRAVEMSADGDLARYPEMNERFHDEILSGVHNRALQSVTQGVRARLAAFRRTQSHDVERRLRLSTADHAPIVEAIGTGAPDEAYAAMRDHNARLNLRHLVDDDAAIARDGLNGIAALAAPSPTCPLP